MTSTTSFQDIFTEILNDELPSRKPTLAHAFAGENEDGEPCYHKAANQRAELLGSLLKTIDLIVNGFKEPETRVVVDDREYRAEP